MGSIVLQQVAEAVTGSADYFRPFVDDALGKQVAAVRELLAGSRILQDAQLLALADNFLLDMTGLLRYRNRLAHDQWTTAIELVGRDDGIYGHRPWGRGERPAIYSTLETVHRISSAWWTVASGLNKVAFAAGLPPPPNWGAAAAAEQHRQAQTIDDEMEQLRVRLRQGLPGEGWHWIVVPPDERPQVRIRRTT